MLSPISPLCFLPVLALISATPVKRQSIASSSISVFSPTPTTNVNPALPAPSADPSSPFPTVTIYPPSNGFQAVNVVGINPTRMYDEFLGIPFAAPPIGTLRFARPQSPSYSSTVSAQRYRPACAQTVYEGHQTFQDLQGEYGTSEDCLYLNVIRPVGVNVTGDGLPVLVFLPGGNFYGGAASAYDGSIIGQIANTMSMPFIQVTIPYRLGVLGWPAGRDVAEAGAANLGMRDAITGLQWVQDNIAAFGGDPARVTAAGQSAGGAIVSLLYLRPDLYYFHSSLVMSAPPSLFNLGNVWEVDDRPWKEYVLAAGCADVLAGTGDVMECLCGRPLESLLEAQTTVINKYGPYALFGPSVDYDLIRAFPFETLNNGAFANKPILMGAVKDEGTTFILPNTSTTEQLEQIIRGGSGPNRSDSTVDTVLSLYPADPTQGSPYGSGNDTFGFPGVFKRAASIFGDMHFQAPRRHFMERADYFGVMDVWAYMFEQPMPASLGIPPYIGTGHHSDTIWSYGRVLTPLFNYTESDQSLSLSMMRYFINFIDHSDPNPINDISAGTGETSDTSSAAVSRMKEWKRYSGEEKGILRLLGGNVTMIRDDYRYEGIGYFNSQSGAFRY